jgi:hypothetical protein
MKSEKFINQEHEAYEYLITQDFEEMRQLLTA